MKKPNLLAILLVLVLLIAAIPPANAASPFADVPPAKWYSAAVDWAYENAYIHGVTETTFCPNSECTRAQIITILWNIAGSPEPESLENPFTDVPETRYYYKPVLWAIENSITNGTTKTTFSPNKTCTRAQAMYFIWQYFGAQSSELDLWHTDIDKNKYYYSALQWAYNNGITNGTTMMTFDPKASVTRAMVVTFLYNARHLLDGEQHEFVLESDNEATCITEHTQTYFCACGVRKTIWLGPALGHDYRAATLVSEATETTPTVYQLRCTRCGLKDAEKHSLGKPIYGEPNIQSDIPTHEWTSAELQNGIRLNSETGSYVVVTRKWFANAWCYIAHITLPAGTYSSFSGSNVYNQFGANLSDFYLSAYDEMLLLPDAKLLVNGDANLFNNYSTLRGGTGYGANVSNGATYWNPVSGTYGRVSDLKTNQITQLKALGVSDTIDFGGPCIVNGAMSKDLLSSAADYDEAGYRKMNYRRQRSAIGFKTEGATVHIYFIVADGATYTNYGSYNPSFMANDRASYGNINREMMLLMSTLNVEYAAPLDGGWSATMMIRKNGAVEQINAADFSLKDQSPYQSRKLWDFLTLS